VKKKERCKLCNDNAVLTNHHHFFPKKKHKSNRIHRICWPCHKAFHVKVRECLKAWKNDCRKCQYAGVCMHYGR